MGPLQNSISVRLSVRSPNISNTLPARRAGISLGFGMCGGQIHIPTRRQNPKYAMVPGTSNDWFNSKHVRDPPKSCTDTRVVANSCKRRSGQAVATTRTVFVDHVLNNCPFENYCKQCTFKHKKIEVFYSHIRYCDGRKCVVYISNP